MRYIFQPNAVIRCRTVRRDEVIPDSVIERSSKQENAKVTA